MCDCAYFYSCPMITASIFQFEEFSSIVLWILSNGKYVNQQSMSLLPQPADGLCTKSHWFNEALPQAAPGHATPWNLTLNKEWLCYFSSYLEYTTNAYLFPGFFPSNVFRCCSRVSIRLLGAYNKKVKINVCIVLFHSKHTITSG